MSFTAKLCSLPLCVSRDESGDTLLETALLLPVALMFTFGVIEFSLFICCYAGATYATSTAVRYAALNGAASINTATSASITAMVRPFLITLPQSGSTVTTVWSPDNSAGSLVTVQVAIVYKTGIPFGNFGTLNTSVTSSAAVIH